LRDVERSISLDPGLKRRRPCIRFSPLMYSWPEHGSEVVWLLLEAWAKEFVARPGLTAVAALVKTLFPPKTKLPKDVKSEVSKAEKALVKAVTKEEYDQSPNIHSYLRQLSKEATARTAQEAKARKAKRAAKKAPAKKAAKKAPAKKAAKKAPATKAAKKKSARK